MFYVILVCLCVFALICLCVCVCVFVLVFLWICINMIKFLFIVCKRAYGHLFVFFIKLVRVCVCEYVPTGYNIIIRLSLAH